MSVSAQQQQKKKNTGSGGASGSGGGQAMDPMAQDATDLQEEFGNGFMSQQVLQTAADQAQDGGLGLVDLAFSLGIGEEDPQKFIFAEDGDDVEGAEQERPQQKEGLPGLRPKHENNEYRDVKDSQAFVKGADDEHAVDPNDVAQGALGDCYLIAGMAAVARASPEAIEKLIKDNGDGTYEVTLYVRKSWYGRPEAVTKTVDSRMPDKNGKTLLYAKTGDQEGGKSELWTALIEKTVAQHKGSYDLISGGNIGKNGFNFHGAMELLTGKTENYHRVTDLDDDDILLMIAIALEEGQPVTCDSLNMAENAELSAEANKQNVYGNHAYVPIDVDLDGSMNLQNPWGSHHVDDLSIADFRKFYRSVRIGEKP